MSYEYAKKDLKAKVLPNAKRLFEVKKWDRPQLAEQGYRVGQTGVIAYERNIYTAEHAVAVVFDDGDWWEYPPDALCVEER